MYQCQCRGWRPRGPSACTRRGTRGGRKINSDEWPVLSSSIAHKWLTEGLQDRSITRDLDWGVPVPADTWPELAAEGKVFYVWFDAPIEYIGATKEWADEQPDSRDWKSWWYEADDSVRYTEFMAKDNVPFHT